METPADSFQSLFEKAESYGKTTFELSKLKLLQTTNIVVSSLVARLFVFILITLFALILSIGVSLFLGEILGKDYYGFMIVAAFYLLVAIIFHFFLQNWVKKLISELIIKQALK